ncbi:uncharacterized protein RSE6_15113 [Rhynchosporium secalis]|uniref:DDE-1 domain-containing protein n=1 Tax=Rhynchosporium secalis TaxID=38038 RepID=A0A1E1MWR3_RHYSE|nr:uncharacterized protein RSE6_15113 [Rhynchosporium secalis]
MPSKGKGAFGHVSEFITHEGRLISREKEAQKIIYPGGTTEYWNTEQLLVQVAESIDIFEERYPNKIPVFIFDQSSAHASHREGALDAFRMNLTEGGVPEPQKATYFPPDTNTKR